MPKTVNPNKPIITVVEELKGQKLESYSKRIYEIDFWIPLIPIKTNLFEKINKHEFKFEIDDDMELDKTGLFKQHLKAKGLISVIDLGNQDKKGNLWELIFNVEDPIAKVEVRIRARDLIEKEALKVGIFIQKIDFNNNLLQGIGRDAVFFALRLYIRKMLQNAAKFN